MCGGGKAPDNSAQIAAQQQSLKLQEEQMAMQKQQMAAQQAQYQEQLAISRAAPPPPPNAVAMAAAPALETASAANPLAIRQGLGRRKLRTDLAAQGVNVPGMS